MRNPQNWASTILRYILLVAAISYILIYLYMAFFRIQYPFELEWIEGLSLDHVRRVVAGQKIYVSPSLEFIPYPYTPLYFYVSAGVAYAIGHVDFVPLRLVSFLSSLGCFYIIFLMVKKETQSVYFSILASGLFAATFRMGGAWFDIARVDSLFLFLLLAGFYLIRFGTSPTAHILAGLFVSLSVLTKQNVLLVLLPIGVYLMLVDWRRSIFFFGTVVTMMGVATLLLDYIHNGWFSYYIFELPTRYSSRIIPEMWLFFWTRDMLPLLLALSLSIFYMLISSSESKQRTFFYLSVAIGMFGTAWIPRTYVGGYNNNLLPAYAVIAILFGLAGHKAFDLIQRLPADKRILMNSYVYLICLIQFFVLIFDPRSQIPTRQDLEAGKNLLAELAQIEGDILMPCHGYLLPLVGKQSSAHQMIIRDILEKGEGTEKNELVHEIRQALTEQRYKAVILDYHQNWFSDEFGKHYVYDHPVFDDPGVFWPVTGFKTRPEFIYFPRDYAATERK